jgi:hypothetical protein
VSGCCSIVYWQTAIAHSLPIHSSKNRDRGPLQLSILEVESHKNGTSNVIAADRQATIAQMLTANLSGVGKGNITFTNEPLVIVSRNDKSRMV